MDKLGILVGKACFPLKYFPAEESSCSSSSVKVMEAPAFLKSPSPPLASFPFFGSPLPPCNFPLKPLAFKPSSPSSPLVFAAASDSTRKIVVPYAVPLEDSPLSSCNTRPLVEILRDLNKRVPDQVLKIKLDNGVLLKYIPWYHANQMLSFYAPGWCGEVRSVAYSSDGKSVTVVYRVTLRGSDGEVFRESSGTVSLDDNQCEDPVQKAEAIAFGRSCARFGLGLYLYHADDSVK